MTLVKGNEVTKKRRDDLSTSEAPTEADQLPELPRVVRNLLSSMTDVTGRKGQPSEEVRRKDIRATILKADLD